MRVEDEVRDKASTSVTRSSRNRGACGTVPVENSRGDGALLRLPRSVRVFGPHGRGLCERNPNLSGGRVGETGSAARWATIRRAFSRGPIVS